MLSRTCSGLRSRVGVRQARRPGRLSTSSVIDPPARWERQAGAFTLLWRAAVVVLLILILVEARAARRDAASAALDAAELRASTINASPPPTPN